MLFCEAKIFYLLSMLSSIMLVHAYLPDDWLYAYFSYSIGKGFLKGDITSKDNYRPIAIACILSNVLELIILFNYGHFLETADNQFEYKKDSSTEMCIFSFNEIVNHYKSVSDNIYVCF